MCKWAEWRRVDECCRWHGCTACLPGRARLVCSFYCLLSLDRSLAISRSLSLLFSLSVAVALFLVFLSLSSHTHPRPLSRFFSLTHSLTPHPLAHSLIPPCLSRNWTVTCYSARTEHSRVIERAFEALQQCLAEHQVVTQAPTRTYQQATHTHQQPGQDSCVPQRVSSPDVMISLRRVRYCHET